MSASQKAATLLKEAAAVQNIGPELDEDVYNVAVRSYYSKPLPRPARTLNSPSLAFKALHGKEPDMFIAGRSGHPQKLIGDIAVDTDFPEDVFNRLNTIPEIEGRASCAGHSDTEYPAYFVFRMKPGTDDKADTVTETLKAEGLAALKDIGAQGRPRIVIAADVDPSKKDWKDFWESLPDKIEKAVGKKSSKEKAASLLKEGNVCKAIPDSFRITPGELSGFQKRALEIMDRKPMYKRPVSALLGRLNSPVSALMLGSLAPFKPGSSKDSEELAEILEAAENNPELENLLVSLGSDRPIKALKRTWTNPKTSWASKLIGTLQWPFSQSLSAVTRGDHYDPYADMVVSYKDDPAVLSHEIGHALDYEKKNMPGLYQLGRLLPPVALYQENKASQLALDQFLDISLEDKKLSEGEKDRIERANRVLGGALGNYTGGYIGALLGKPLALPGAIIGQGIGAGTNPFLTGINRDKWNEALEGLKEEKRTASEKAASTKPGRTPEIASLIKSVTDLIPKINPDKIFNPNKSKLDWIKEWVAKPVRDEFIEELRKGKAEGFKHKWDI